MMKANSWRGHNTGLPPSPSESKERSGRLKPGTSVSAKAAVTWQKQFHCNSATTVPKERDYHSTQP
jgi:hypothetical protein